jgi:hypothetical protein
VFSHPNYTFSIPDKRLYTLFKGTTVTPCFVRATSVSSHGRASFTRGAFYLSFVRRPLHVRRAYVWRVPLTRLGPPRKPSLRRRSDSRHRLSHRKAPKPPIWPLPVQRRCLLNEWGPWSICTFGAEAPQCRTNRGQASTCG